MAKASRVMTATGSSDDFRDPGFVARLQAKEPATLRVVVEAYLDQIYRAARGTGLDQHQAEDVTQETFATFIQTADRFQGRSHVRTWLFGILYKKVAEARRGIRRDGGMENLEATLEQRFAPDGRWARPPRPADLDLEESEIGRLIEECLEAATSQQRLAFILREVEGLSSQEICKALQVTVTNLGVLLYRVRNRLRECLEKRGVERS